MAGSPRRREGAYSNRVLQLVPELVKLLHVIAGVHTLAAKVLCEACDILCHLHAPDKLTSCVTRRAITDTRHV